MISQISRYSCIYDTLNKAKEEMDEECEDILSWITDIIENPERNKRSNCEICASNHKLELHHIRGRKHGDEIITVCYECHKELTNKQRLWDGSWYDSNAENKDAFLKRGLIDVCELRYEKTGNELCKKFSEQLTEGFSYG